MEDLVVKYAYIAFDGIQAMVLKGFSKEIDNWLHETHYQGCICVPLETNEALELAEQLYATPEYQESWLENPTTIMVIGNPKEGFSYNGPYDSHASAMKALEQFPDFPATDVYVLSK